MTIYMCDLSVQGGWNMIAHQMFGAFMPWGQPCVRCNMAWNQHENSGTRVLERKCWKTLQEKDPSLEWRGSNCCPAKDHRSDQGTGAALLLGEAEREGTALHGEQKDQKGNGQKLKLRGSLWNIRKHTLTVRVIKHWHKLPMEVLELHSLQIFKRHLDTLQGNLHEVALLEQGCYTR